MALPLISFGAVSSVQVAGGVLGNTCAKLFIPAGGVAALNMNFSLTAGNYYMWSIHALQDSPGMEGRLGIPGGDQLGQVILKPAQWTCSYGIKRFNYNSTGSVMLTIRNSTATQGIIYLADVQVVSFPNLADAIAYTQSRAFLQMSNELSILGTGLSASGIFTWGEEGSFEMQSSHNIRSIERRSAGLYAISFEMELPDLPVPQLTTETIGENNTILATYKNLSPSGLTVVLVSAEDGATPLDGSFSLWAG